jgi:hypothetical protein
LQDELDWLKHEKIQQSLMNPLIDDEWFQAYSSKFIEDEKVAYHSAFVPLDLVDEILKKTDWDCDPLECFPCICSNYENGKESRIYQPYGNQRGIEPLVFERTFHGLQKGFLEVSQEFRLFHNLYPGAEDEKFYFFNDTGEKSVAVKIADGFIEIRKDLLRKFCAAKQMALVFFVDCFRLGRHSLEEFSQSEIRRNRKEKYFHYDYALVEYKPLINKGYKSCCRVIGKKVILPPSFPPEECIRKNEEFHSFIIGVNDDGNEVKKVCGPYLDRPEYLIPVFFNREVLSKYYSNPHKYSVRDGGLWCGNLWHISIDNDHDDHVAVFLGDLGRDLPEKERSHWVSFNIPPHGRTLSDSEIARSFMAQFCDSSSVELVFKRKYSTFNAAFLKTCGWSLFLPLHADDEHCLNSLFLPENNINDFEKNIGFLVKLLIDSLNEEKIYQYVQTKDKKDNEKGISKLEKYFSELQLENYQAHIAFLRLMQDLRSKMAAHRKGSGYENIKKELGLNAENYKQKFKEFLRKSVQFLEFLEYQFLNSTKAA